MANAIKSVSTSIITNEFEMSAIQLENADFEDLSAKGQDIKEADLVIVQNILGNEKVKSYTLFLWNN